MVTPHNTTDTRTVGKRRVPLIGRHLWMDIKSVTIASEKMLRFSCAPLIRILFRIAHPGFSQVCTLVLIFRYPGI